MAKLKWTKNFSTGSISDNGTWEKNYPLSEDNVLRRIVVQDTDGNALSKSLFHLEIGAENIFADDLPTTMLQADIDFNMEINRLVKAGETIKMILKNLEGTTKACYVTLVFDYPE